MLVKLGSFPQIVWNHHLANVTLGRLSIDSSRYFDALKMGGLKPMEVHSTNSDVQLDGLVDGSMVSTDQWVISPNL